MILEHLYVKAKFLLKKVIKKLKNFWVKMIQKIKILKKLRKVEFSRE
jgi:hypothetical protein